MSFSDLQPGDVFLMMWWLNSGPAPRAYLVVTRDCVLPNERDYAFEIIRLEAANEKSSIVHLSMLEEAQERGELKLLEILSR